MMLGDFAVGKKGLAADCKDIHRLFCLWQKSICHRGTEAQKGK